MTGIYFSGTGNSRYAIEFFCREYDMDIKVYSIENPEAKEAIANAESLVFSYPVQFSTVPKIVRDYVTNNGELWKNKKVF